MTLAAGNKIGFYEILVQIGAGGMGEVYRAHDTKLNRDVALKVLPSEFANDAERMGRFKREAQLLASLNHTNIAAIYGLEESGGVRALIMELAEGPTLAERILKNRIPLDEALSIARQIAEALEAAHEKGIIHRDLKPANIKITPEGAVKVLDFGLAKALEGEAAIAEASESPTLSLAATKAGVILGTAAYMAPEQACGSGVDKRCDIWSFGVVLFEMLTGKELFAGQTVSDTLAAVLRADIDWNLLPANTPPSIRTLLRRCLTKDRKQRLQAVGEARITIEEYLANPARASLQETAPIAGRQRLRERIAWGAVVLAAIVAGIAVWNLKPPEPHTVMRFSYELPADQQFSFSSGQPFIAISQDGSQFAYTTERGLYVRSLNALDAKPIAGTDESPMQPFFSPDGKSLGYWSRRNQLLKKISLATGSLIQITDRNPTGSLSWLPDNTILYALMGDRDIIRVSANGGTPAILIEAKDEEFYHPRFLQNEASLLFTLGPPPYRNAVQSLKSGKRQELFPGHYAQYLSTGHLIYVEGDDLFAVPFDEDKLEKASDPVLMVPGIFQIKDGAPHYAISSSGTLIYVPQIANNRTSSSNRTLVWVDRNGNEETLGVLPNYYNAPRISPDGSRVAVASISSGGNKDIYLCDLSGKDMHRLIFDPAEDQLPVWSPNGKQIAFFSYGKKHTGLFCQAADGTGNEESLRTGAFIFPGSWLDKAKVIIAHEQLRGIGALSLEGDHKWKTLLPEKHYTQPRISPDGNWLAYTSTNELGQNEIWVRPYPEVNGGRWQVSKKGGDSPLWSPVGRELFFRDGDAVIAVSYKTEPSFSPGTPEILFRRKYVAADLTPGQSGLSTWDVSRNGNRFLMMKELDSAGEGPRRINIILNWFEELKQKVPIK
jgi:eukaryotic-like serine/threonine-protein kinase